MMSRNCHSMDAPLVSIVTPCRNSAPYIKTCIESLMEQSYPFVEHIIQDSESTDGTLYILKQFGKGIDWRSEPDSCQADGLNKALKRSRGDIILVLNANDFLLPHAAAWAVLQMDNYPDDAVIYGDLYIVNQYDEIIGAQFGKPYDFKSVLRVEQVLPAQAAFIRRAHFEKVRLGSDAALDTCPDYEMWIRIGLQFQMRYVPCFLSKYRYHPHADGNDPRSVKRFRHAKREVMDRVFNDPQTSPEIRQLKRRAYGGLSL